MSQNPKLVQHKRGPSSVLLKLLDHVSLVSINTPGTTTSFSFKCSNPEFAGFGLCQWFAFTSDPSSPTNSNQCDVPSSESSRKCWVFCTTCFCTSRRTRPKCNNTSKIHSPPAWNTVKISRMPSMWSMRSTMGSTMGSVRSTAWSRLQVFTASSSGFAIKSCKWFSSSSPFADFSAISGVVEDSDTGSKTSPCTVSASTNEISSFMRANGQGQEHGA